MRQPFVGRVDLLEMLRERYRKAQCGDGGAVILRGEAGIGKSRLIERFLDEIRASDPCIVETAARDYASSPFAPIVDVVESWLERRAELFDLHPGLRDAVDLILQADARGNQPSGTERRRCFDAVAQLFRFAAADAPTTLVVDDLHYADPATLLMLRHIVAATRRSAFLFLGASRPSAAPDGFAGDEISRLERLENVHSVLLGPLHDDECQALILDASAGRLGRDQRYRIATRSEGNPLFAEELVRQALATERGGAQGVPATIRDAVLERFSLLAPEGREDLRLASAFGRSFDASLLARIAGRAIEDVHANLRSAVGLGLIEETEDPNVLRFRHALMQEAIYGALLQAERRELHRRILAELRTREQSVDGIAALAFHAHASGEREGTAYYNELAGDQATSNQAFETAAEFYERALSVHAESEPEAARVAQKLATTFMLSGFPDRAVRPARIALAQHRMRGDLEGVATVLMLLADVAGQVGEDERRLDLLAETSEVLAAAPEPRLQAKRALCMVELAIANHDVDAVIEGCEDIVNSANVELPVAIALRNAAAQAYLMQREWKAAIRAQALAVRLAAESGSEGDLSGSRFAEGVVFALGGELESAAESFGQAAAIARARWAATERAISVAFQGEMELIRGNAARARDLLEEALEEARRSDHPTLILMTGRVGIWLGMRLEDVALTRRVVADLDLETLFREKTPERFFPLSGAFAQYLADEGRNDEARDILARAVRRLSKKRLRSTDWSPCTVMTIATLGDEADIPAARRPIEEWFTPYASAFVDLFDALVAERLGNAAEAARIAERAIEPLGRYEFRFEQAAAQMLSGRKHDALAFFERFGAEGMARRLREELRPKNRRGRPADELTAREREVAGLVAEGLTNREICDRLSVSEKTVETHLASIFAKLGVRTRSEVEGRLGALAGSQS